MEAGDTSGVSYFALTLTLSHRAREPSMRPHRTHIANPNATFRPRKRHD